MKREESWSFSQDDFDRFAHISGDDNPIHVDPEFCANTRFGRPVAHGMMLYANVLAAMKRMLPNKSWRQASQEMMFANPTFTHTEVTLVCRQLEEKEPDCLKMEARLFLPGGELAFEGRSVFRKGFDSDGCPHPDSESKNQSHKGLKLGDSCSLTRMFTTQDMAQYADLCDDAQPEEVPGPLLSGMFSNILGTKLPGRGTNWLKQQLTFCGRAEVGETLTARMVVTRLRPEKDLVDLSGTLVNAKGELICAGRSLVLIKDLIWP